MTMEAIVLTLLFKGVQMQFKTFSITAKPVLFLLLAIAAEGALAAATSLPIGEGLTVWREFSTGALALTISLVALITVIGSLAYAGELAMLGRVSVPLFVCIGLIILAVGSLTAMFGAGSAVI